MTTETLQKFQDAVTEAESAARQAADAAAASPTDTKLQAAKADADTKLEQAREALAAAELQGRDTSEEIKANKGRIVFLAVYLVAVGFLSIYLLAGFFMAETDPVEVEKRRAEDTCCNILSNTNTANSATTNSNANRANTNSTDSNANSNSANSNAAASPTPIASPALSPSVAPASSPLSTTVTSPSPSPKTPVSTPSPTATATVAPTKTATPDLAIPEMSIPKNVYVRFPGFSTGDVWSAESYLFLIVFVAGMLGGTIRALHSLVRHLGMKDFSFYWSGFYITLPLTSSGLAIVVYFVLRGGFYGGGVGKGLVLNIFSFAALAALTGLFTDNAMERLKKAADTMLADVPSKVENAGEIQARKDAEKKTE